MKRNFLLLATTILLSFACKAQTLFSSSFGSLTLQSYTIGNSVSIYTTAPAAFNLIEDLLGNNAGTASNPNSPFNVPQLKYSGWVVAYNQNVNDTFLVSTSWQDDTVSTNDWIITPSVNVGANTVLTWLAMSPDPSHSDGYEIYATNKTGVLTANDFVIGDRIYSLADGHTTGGGEKSTWTRRSVNVGNFAGQTLRFAFRNNSKDMYQLWIDDIEVVNTAKNLDCAAASLQTEKYVLTGSNQTLALNVVNQGAVNINSVTVNFMYGNSVNTQTFGFADGLSYLQSAQLPFSLPYSFSSAGYYVINSWISSVNGTQDNDLSNDTTRFSVTAQVISPPKNVLFEQFLSANNGDSPGGQQTELELAYQSPSFIAVNVHDEDSMRDPGASALLSSYRKNYVTALIDRVYQSDLSSAAVNKQFYSSKFYDRLGKVTPASVSVINKSYDVSTRQLSFTVKADFTGEVRGDYRLNAYLTENLVYGDPADSTLNGYNQVNNYYNVPWSFYYLLGYYYTPINSWIMDAWWYKHQDVLVHSFDGSFGNSGVIPQNGGTAGQSFQQTYTLTLPIATNNAFKFIPDNIYIVGFVAEYNADKNQRNVLNAAKEKLTPNGETVGIKEQKQVAARLNLYPNPCSGILNVGMLKASGNYHIRIYDLLGEKVWEKILMNVNETEKLDISGLGNGMYVVELSSGSGIFKQKITVRNQ